ncbi:MAG TPA: class I SAM-dependent methyltransferase [Vicinamibacterales bacterium]|nr:class I SAM-dependent methyltransferase [Vicinamibacterales bacterium]
MTTTSSYDAFYYRNCVGGDEYKRTRSWLEFNAGIADRIVRDIAPKTMLDAGCGFGFLVEALRERGVDAAGVDVSEYAIQHVHESVRAHCWAGSLVEDLPRMYDAIVSVEVLEHVPAGDAERVIANICAHTSDVLFSSTPFDRKELTHVNVQPPEHWAEQFARHGFFRDVDFDASFITPWAARFRRRHEPVHRIVREYERRYSTLEYERNEIRQKAFELQRQLAEARAPLPQQAWRIVRRLGGRLLRPFR